VALLDDLAKYAAEHFPQEWRILIGAPRPFAVLVTLGWAVGWFAIWLYFRRDIRGMKDRIEHQGERLRLTPSVNRFDHLTNRELRRETRELVARLRALVENGRAEWTTIFFPKQRPWESQPPKPDDGSLTEAKMRFNDRFHSEYEKRFKTDSSLLQGELLKRIPEKEWPHKSKIILDQWNPADSQNPLGAWEIVQTADDLEALVKLRCSRLRRRRRTEAQL
jgi:hypothetical protein